MKKTAALTGALLLALGVMGWIGTTGCSGDGASGSAGAGASGGTGGAGASSGASGDPCVNHLPYDHYNCGQCDNECKGDSVCVDSKCEASQCPFTTQAIYDADRYPESVEVTDVNGDGKPDILVAVDVPSIDAPGVIDVLLNKGDGTFAPKVSYMTSGGDARQVAAGDFDGDGKVDIAAVSYHGDKLDVWKNQGGGVFGQMTSYTVGTFSGHVAAADFDGDNVIDLLVEQSPTMLFLRNKGDGTFDAPVLSYGPGDGLQLADMDGDGSVDVIQSDALLKQLYVLKNKGNGELVETSVSIDFTVSSAVAADFDGDGTVDVAARSRQTDTVVIFKNDGTGKLTQQSSNDVRPGAFILGVVDEDGDGKPEVAALSNENASVSVLHNEGGGKLAPLTFHAVAEQPFAFAAGDVNGDGKGDLVVVDEDRESGNVIVLLSGCAK